MWNGFVWPETPTYWTSSRFLTRRSNEPALIPLLFYASDGTAYRVVGWLCEVYDVDATIADGTANAAGTRIVYNALAWPGGNTD